MKKRVDVYGIGNAITDLLIFCEPSDLEALSLTPASMTLVDAKQQGAILDYFSARSAQQSSGGSVANSVVGLAQLGSKTAFAGVVGEDPYGHFYLQDMRGFGVEVPSEFYPELQSGTSVVLITPDGERTMATHLGATSMFGPEHVAESLLKESRYLLIEGYLLSTDLGAQATRRAVSLAKEHGTKVVTSLSAQFIVEFFRERLEELLAESDIVFGNREEVCTLAGIADPEAALEYLGARVPCAVMTVGAEGAWVVQHGETVKVAGYEAEALDVTGAGDIFASGFLHGVCQGVTVAASARLGCYLASMVITQVGARLNADLSSVTVDTLPS